MLYISGPMTKMKDLNRPVFFDAEDRLHGAGYQVRNPARIDEWFPKACGHSSDVMVIWCDDCASRTWRWYMRKALVQMIECDGVAILEGWRDSRGATLEVGVAAHLGMEIHTVDHWVKFMQVSGNGVKVREEEDSDIDDHGRGR